jgi:hypothetical protein
MREIIDLMRVLNWEEGRVAGPERFFITKDLVFVLTLYTHLQWWTLGFFCNDDLDGYEQMVDGHTLEDLQAALPRIPITSLMGLTNESDSQELLLLAMARCTPDEARASIRLQ